jgi:beta-lactam-binding protein with PASTA domain
MMRTSALFLVFTLTGAQLLPAAPHEVTLDQTPQAARTYQRPDRINPPPAVVPDLSRVPEQAWSSVLARSRLRLGKVVWVDSDRPRGTLLRQEPQAGSPARPDMVVTLYVSKGPIRPDDPRPDRTPADRQFGTYNTTPRDLRPDGTIVPDLRPIDPSDWSKAILRRDLKPGRVVTVDSELPKGALLEQHPEAGSRVPRGTEVHVKVSNGPGQRGTKVPGVVGEHIEQARLIIEKYQLQVGSVRAVESSEKRGTVLKQDPGAGELVPVRSEVHLVVSEGPRVIPPPPPPPPVRVPNVIGELLDPARIEIEGNQLRFGGVKWVDSPRPRGTVIFQSPEPDRLVRMWSPVHVEVSQGPPPPVPTIVPAVVGEHIDNALVLVRNAVLRPGALRTVASKEARGIVVAQWPDAGATAERNSVVHLNVSAGEPPVIVPDLLEKRVEAAKPTLESRNLQLGSVTKEEAPSDPGIVVGQEPSPGSKVPPGTRVNVRVSVGEWVDVPNLVRSDIAVATRVLNERRLQVGAVDEREAPTTPGTVLSQSHAPGARVRKGTAIGVTVSTEELFSVPDVVRGLEDHARDAVTKARLRVGVIRREHSSIDAGMILAQEPPAGTRVPANTPVNLRVSLGDPWATVPDLVKTDLATATRLLQARELQIGAADQKEAPTTPGTVLNQSHAPGSRVRKGTSIGVTVSTQQLFAVPDVIRGMEDHARDAVTKAGLRLGGISREHSSAQAGVILAQEPPPGTRVAANTAVNLRVSLGPPLVVVPALVANNIEAARALAASVNLQVLVQRGESRSQAGIVLAQSPQAGLQVPRGTAINVVVSTEQPKGAEPPAPPLPPDSSGRSQPPDPQPPKDSSSPSPDPAQPPPGSDAPPPPVERSPKIPDLPWSWVATAAFSAPAAIQRWRSGRIRVPPSEPPQAPRLPQIELLPRLDVGRQAIDSDQAGRVFPALELIFAKDAGVQRVVESPNRLETEHHHEYANTDAERPLPDRSRRAS